MGVEAFRALVPGAFTEHDPTPTRDLIFMLPATELAGRSATMGTA
jgi:hypothetical protein